MRVGHRTGAGRTRPGRPGALLLPGAVALLFVLAGCATLADVAVEQPAREPVTAVPAPVVPTSLRIPAIGVAEPELVPLGIAPDGSAEVPQDFDRVGRFDRGGNPGPIVLMGHVDSRDGPAVFFDLHELRPGDAIELGRDDGTVARYAVEHTRQVPKGEFPTFDVFGGGPIDQLRLVTCAGAFDRGEGSYSDNLVVYARAV